MARRDHFYDPKAPRPNSIKPAAAVALFDGDGRILLLRRKDNDKWTMPGGTMEFGESLVECAVREVREETGFDIEISGLIGTYTDPNVPAFPVLVMLPGAGVGMTDVDGDNEGSEWERRGFLSPRNIAQRACKLHTNSWMPF